LIEAATCLEFADPKGSAQASWNLADVSRSRGDLAAAVPHLDRALRLYQSAKQDVAAVKRDKVLILLGLDRIVDAANVQRGLTPVPPELLSRLNAEVDRRVAALDATGGTELLSLLLALDPSTDQLRRAEDRYETLGKANLAREARLEWVLSIGEDSDLLSREVRDLTARYLGKAVEPAPPSRRSVESPNDLVAAERTRLAELFEEDQAWAGIPSKLLALGFKVAMAQDDTAAQSQAWIRLGLIDIDSEIVGKECLDMARSAVEEWVEKHKDRTPDELVGTIRAFATAATFQVRSGTQTDNRLAASAVTSIHGALLAALVKGASSLHGKKFDQGHLETLWRVGLMGSEKTVQDVFEICENLKATFPVSLRAYARYVAENRSTLDEQDQTRLDSFRFTFFNLDQASLNETIAICDEYRALDPDENRGVKCYIAFLTAWMRIMAGDLEGAEKMRTEVDSLIGQLQEADKETFGPIGAGALLNMLDSELQLAKGDIEAARKTLAQMKYGSGNYRESSLARVYYAMGLDRIAQGFAEFALDLSDGIDSQDVPCLTILASIASRSGKVEEAISLLRSALASTSEGILQDLPRNTVKRQLAQYLYQAGREDDADKLVREADIEQERFRGNGRLPAVLPGSPSVKSPGDFRVTSTTPPPLAKAAGSVHSIRNYALVVGTDNYAHFPSLSNAVRDATAVGEVLRRDYGFTVFQLMNPSQRQFKAALLNLNKLAFNPMDQLLIYVSGHGALNELVGGMLVFADTPKSIIEATSEVNGFTFGNLESALPLNCGHLLVMIDTCYSGDFIRWFDRNRQARATKGEPGYEASKIVEELTRPTRLVITAGEANEQVPDGKPGENSPFAQRILQRLRQPGPSGIVTYYGLCDDTTWVGTKRLTSSFSGDAPGSNFFFIHKDALAKMK